MTRKNSPFAYAGLDRIIHERARLAILSSLMAHQGEMAFNDLKQACGLTDGNMSRHLQVLQDAEFIDVDKRFKGVKPLTTLTLTSSGRKRFLEYVEVLEQVVNDAAKASRQKQGRSTNIPPAKPA